MKSQIIYGDALVTLASLPDKSVDLVLTDPPYIISEKEKIEVHEQLLRVCEKDILVFCPPENQWRFPGVQYLFWVKPTSTKNYSRRYGRFVEMVFLYQRGSTWNRSLNWANYTGVFHDVVTGESGHPHEKPSSLIERFIRIHSNLGDIVCDPFCGSGTVLKVAKQLGREYIGIESDYQTFLSIDVE